MGVSGSGKSTLIRTVIRLVEPSAGAILIEGADICQYSPSQLRAYRQQKIAMVFQKYGLFPHYTLIDNVRYGLRIQKRPLAEQLRLAQEKLDLVGLNGWEHYYPHQLSGGMQQRVGLARALASDPDILLMDEPFSGLDPLIRKQMQKELVSLLNKLNKTIIFVTHDLREAILLGDRIAIMKAGEIEQIGTPEDIIRNPATDYIREFTEDVTQTESLLLTASPERHREVTAHVS